MSGDRYELPSGWTWANLKDVVAVGSTQVIPKRTPEQRFNYLALEHIEPLTGRIVNFAPTLGRNIGSNKFIFKTGDVLYGRLRPYLRKAVVVDFDGVSATDLIPLRSRGPVEPSYLQRYLVSPQTLTYVHPLMAGIKMPRLRSQDLYAMPLPLAPKNEQRRIVAKIEALFEQSRAAREALDRVSPLLKKCRQSVLAAAFRGDLTRDWREQHSDVEPASALLERTRDARLRRYQEELKKLKTKGRRPQKPHTQFDPHNLDTVGLPKLPQSWAWAAVGFLASPDPRSIQSGPFGSNLHHAEFQHTGVLAIGIDNVLDGRFSTGSQHRISYQKYEQLKKYTARALDVLITVMATVGRCCVFPEDTETAITTKHVYRISVDRELCEPKFLMNALRGCTVVLEQLYGEIQGVTRPGINGQILKRLRVPIPPLEEQRVIVSRIETLTNEADDIAAVSRTARRQIDKLEQSILTRAFRGELVAQDANDEPASALIERIRSERSTGTRAPTIRPRRGEKIRGNEAKARQYELLK